jgi:hypothetical protein
VAARAVVTKDVPPYAVVAGVPAKVVRYRLSESQVDGLLASKWWEFSPWALKGARVDDPPAFLDFVASLRASGTKPHTPDEVRLAELAAGYVNPR